MFHVEKEYEGKLEEVSDKLLMHLRAGGYVVVADIDVKSILKRALNFNFKDYHIYEICKPEAAREIIGDDDLNGLFVPCKMIVYEDGRVTKLRLLKSSVIVNHFYSKGESIIRKYEDELMKVIDSFQP
jgi:uncharacterized protein (DUF302 family)